MLVQFDYSSAFEHTVATIIAAGGTVERHGSRITYILGGCIVADVVIESSQRICYRVDFDSLKKMLLAPAS